MVSPLTLPQSDYIFRDFYTHLARIKIASEGFPGDDLTDQQKEEEGFVELTAADKEAYVARLNEEMPGLNLRVEDVSLNMARRQFAKNTSNSGLGKLSQNDVRKNVVCSLVHRIF